MCLRPREQPALGREERAREHLVREPLLRVLPKFAEERSPLGRRHRHAEALQAAPESIERQRAATLVVKGLEGADEDCRLALVVRSVPPHLAAQLLLELDKPRRRHLLLLYEKRGLALLDEGEVCDAGRAAHVDWIALRCQYWPAGYHRPRLSLLIVHRQAILPRRPPRRLLVGRAAIVSRGHLEQALFRLATLASRYQGALHCVRLPAFASQRRRRDEQNPTRSSEQLAYVVLFNGLLRGCPAPSHSLDARVHHDAVRSTTMPATHEQCHYYNPERIGFAFEGPSSLCFFGGSVWAGCGRHVGSLMQEGWP